jgi:excisionase family DNA binding protein
MSIDADPSSGLLTIPDVAELLRISIPTVRRLQQHRKIPFVKVGGCVRFVRSDIAAYLEQRRVRSIDQ